MKQEGGIVNSLWEIPKISNYTKNISKSVGMGLELSQTEFSLAIVDLSLYT